MQDLYGTLEQNKLRDVVTPLAANLKFFFKNVFQQLFKDYFPQNLVLLLRYILEVEVPVYY